MFDKKEKNKDINIKIREFNENGEIPKDPMNIPVDYLSYFMKSDMGINITEILDSKYQFLFGIRKSFKDNTYEIINPLKISNQTKKTEEEIKNLRKKLWYLVNSGEDEDEYKINEDYILNENDIIKLGDCLFEVVKKNVIKNDKNNFNNKDQLYDISSMNNNFGPVFNICIDNKEEKSEQNNQNNINNNENNKNNSNIKEDNLKDSNINKNPIIKLCDCYNHFECIKSRLFSELKIKQKLEKEKVIGFNIDEFKCNVCGKNIPLRFEKSGKIYNFLEFEDVNYIVLEYLGKIIDEIANENNGDKNIEDKELKKVYIIKLENEIKIGRNSEKIINDINIQDKSIFYSHSVIKFNNDNGNLILENRNKDNIENTSTFVLIKDNFKLKRKKIKFKAGYCYITINLISHIIIFFNKKWLINI